MRVFFPLWPAAARVVRSALLQDKAVVSLEPAQPGLSAGALGVLLSCWVISGCSFGGNCGFGCCGAYPWLESRGLSRVSGRDTVGSCHPKQPRGVCLSPRFAEGQTGGKIGRDSVMRFWPLLISGSAWALQGCTFHGDIPVLPWENCLYTHLHRWQSAQVYVWYPRVPQARVQLCQRLCMDAWASWKCVPSVQSSQKSKRICFLFTWLPLWNRHVASRNTFLSPWIATAIWKQTCQNPIRTICVLIPLAQFKCKKYSQFPL